MLKIEKALYFCVIMCYNVKYENYIIISPYGRMEIFYMIDKIKSESMDLLFEAILTLDSVDDCYKFFDDLCTSIELKAFAQRLHVAKLLDEHRVYNSIVTETGASTATISRVNRSLKDGNDGYNIVFDRLKEKNLL